jgi:hemerythrin-like domain-containing protein
MSGPGTYNTDTSDMFAVHRAILGALEAAPAYVGGAGADAERTELIGSYYDNVLELLNVHHSGEDKLLYSLLEERCVDSRTEIARINEQHKLLDEPLDAGRSAVASWRSAPSREGAQTVVDSLADIDAVLRPHLADEEVTVVPLCSEWLSPEEWGQLPAHAIQTYGADKVWLALGLVFEQVPPATLDAILAGMPPELQEVWREQWRPAFNDYIAQVRG